MATLEIRALRKRFGSLEILKGIDISLEQGGFLVLVGPSGCGKSTLLRDDRRPGRRLRQAKFRSAAGSSTSSNRVNAAAPWCFRTMRSTPTCRCPTISGYALKVAGEHEKKRDRALRKIREVAKMLAIEDYLDRKPSAAIRGPAPACRHGPGHDP